MSISWRLSVRPEHNNRIHTTRKIALLLFRSGRGVHARPKLETERYVVDEPTSSEKRAGDVEKRLGNHSLVLLHDTEGEICADGVDPEITTPKRLRFFFFDGNLFLFFCDSPASVFAPKRIIARTITVRAAIAKRSSRYDIEAAPYWTREGKRFSFSYGSDSCTSDSGTHQTGRVGETASATNAA